MDVPSLVRVLTIAGIVALLVFDFIFHVRRAHIPTLKEAAVWSSVYVGIALGFGLGIFAFGGAARGPEYLAGFITKKALSVDNLFVFLVIMTSFRVPREDQQKGWTSAGRLQLLIVRIKVPPLARPFSLASKLGGYASGPAWGCRKAGCA